MTLGTCTWMHYQLCRTFSTAIFVFIFDSSHTYHLSHLVSACHGAGDDPLSPSCYPSKFFNWWNGVFPHPASELTNGAMRRTNSAYFSFCNAHHIPDITDLVIVELDVEDSRSVPARLNCRCISLSLKHLTATPFQWMNLSS